MDAGVILAWVGQAGEEVPDVPADSKPGVVAAPIVTPIMSDETTSMTGQKQSSERELGFISPVVAKLAAENKVDLANVPGTGEHGRITKKDILDYIEKSNQNKGAKPEPAPWETPGSGDLFKPTVDLSTPPTTASTPPLAATRGGDTLLPMTTKRKAIADHMIMSKHTSAHVTTVMEADLSRVIVHKLG